jgi:2-haloacid dehalogenase
MPSPPQIATSREKNAMAQQSIYIFDAYGTLLDLSAAARQVLAAYPDQARLLAEIWRGRQLEYAWTDMALGHSTNFWDATTRALDTALTLVGLDNATALREALLAAYSELDAYADALPTLEHIVAKGGRTFVYSNANPEMLQKSITAAGLDKVLEEAVSVDGAGVYKPHPQSYAYIQAYLGVDPKAAYFVSSNPWDASGAANAGFQGIWVNRLQHPNPFPKITLHREVATLSELQAAA